MKTQNEDDCIRMKMKVGKENYYVIVGHDFLHVTCPRENSPQMKQERIVMEKLCELVNEIRPKLGGKK